MASKDCFPTTNRCHNCMRKDAEEIKKEKDPKEDSKRCSGCHLVTYCDKDCQMEHWKKVHRSHCRFLSGKTHVKNSKHNAGTCVSCDEQNRASPFQLRNANSPKTSCNIEEVTLAMKKVLSKAFRFHGDGRKCKCSMEFACELPFSLGEVSGQYLEIDGTGQDAMLAHALKILTAMFCKTQEEDRKNFLNDLWWIIIAERAILWYHIIVSGVSRISSKEHLSNQVDSLRTIYGAENPWWKALKFSVNFVVITNSHLTSNFDDSHSLEDLRFQKLKIVHEHKQSQLQNQAIVCKEKTWSKFMLWPELVNGSLTVLLPPGTRCQSCYNELCGEMAVTPYEVNSETLPCLLSIVSSNGELMASCSIAKNPNCRDNCLSKDVERRTRQDKEKCEEFVKEVDLFFIECRGCDVCLKSSLFSHRCSACLAAQYCSTVCQKEDLEFHRTVCASWAKNESKKILGKRKQKNYWKSVFEKDEELNNYP